MLQLTVKQNGEVVMSKLSGQLEDAAAATMKAYANLRHLRHMEKSGATNSTSNAVISDEVITERVKEKDRKLPAELLIMQPIFRFLQLLCENHNSELQVCYCLSFAFVTEVHQASNSRTSAVFVATTGVPLDAASDTTLIGLVWDNPTVLCATAKNRSNSPNWSAIFVGK